MTWTTRIVSIDTDKDRLADFLEGGDRAPQYQAAIGYLVSWPNFADCDAIRINAIDPTDIVAAYFRTGRDVAPYFVLGAVWRDGENKYSFHS